MATLRNTPERDIYCSDTKLQWFFPNLLCENCRVMIVPLPIISQWPCCFKYMLKDLAFFSPPICPCRICQCKIWLQYEMLDNFLFKCFQCLFLMPISHHKAVKKGSLICVLCVQRVFSFVGQHKLPQEAENIIEKFLCVGLCFSPFWLGWAFLKHECMRRKVWGCRCARRDQATTAEGVAFLLPRLTRAQLLCPYGDQV